MTEPKDSQEEFIISLKALMIRYNVKLERETVDEMYPAYDIYFQNNDCSINILLNNLEEYLSV